MPRLFKASGEYDGEPVTLVPPGARTANGSGPAVPVGAAHTARLTQDVTAAAGTTPTLTVTLETSDDGVTWRAVGAFAGATGVGPQRRSFSGLDRFIRGTWVVGGTTPSFTFAVAGELV